MNENEFLWGFKVVNWGAGPCLRETWGIRPEGDDLGRAHWPTAERETNFATIEELQARVVELLPLLDWRAVA